MPAVDERTSTPEDDWFDVSDSGGTSFLEDLEIRRVSCPDCGRPIALVGDEDQLPQHALLPTAWSPFSSAVCAGSGRAAARAALIGDQARSAKDELAVLLALPAELDWRRQPFSHAG
jgi:hypothetical protein